MSLTTATCLLAASLLAGVVAALNAVVVAAGERRVSLDVQFRLTDLDYKPLAGVPVRLVFGDVLASPQAGRRIVTDRDGQARLTLDVTLDQVTRKLPTNFVDSLLSRAKATDHLRIGAELPYLSHQWLYVVDVYRVADSGDVVSDGVSLYSRAADGRFTSKAALKDGGWDIADLRPLRMTTLGYDAWNFQLQPKPGAASAWTLSLAFRKSPEPIVR